MRAWWWTLITAHLVWGNPERFKDDYGNTINLETSQNSVAEDKNYPSFILSPKTIYTRIERSSSENDEHDKRQMRFHSWGGKRYGDEEEEEIGDNNETEENIVFHEPGDEDFSAEDPWYFPSNGSSLAPDGTEDRFREAFTKRIKSSPAFSSWAGKRDPEMLNDLSKRSNFFSPIYQRSSLDSQLEQSRKRYPSFSSWAGKRATAFNSWGGKRDHTTENGDSSRAKRGYPKANIECNEDTGNQCNLNKEQPQVYTGLNSEDNLNFQDHDAIESTGQQSMRVIPEDKGHHSPQARRFLVEYENPTFKRAASFNSWGGKRTSGGDLVIMKKPASFNSWAGKRAAAFNSWGGKRAAAFNSWGGKRAAAFNSWGGKRAAAFNSWGGKRAAAFNSWGGKRAAAFNSWGGKRAAAFNSWGGKRAAAFNSWGGKRDVDEWNEESKLEYPIWTSKLIYGVRFPLTKGHDQNFGTKTNNVLHLIDGSNTSPEYTVNHATDNNFDQTKENILKNNYDALFKYKQFKSENAEEFNNHEKDNTPKTLEVLGNSDILTKQIPPSFGKWAGKRSPLFSSWYSSKIPTVQLTNGKRRPAFSSWGGKRSENQAALKADCSSENTSEENVVHQKAEEINSEEQAPPGEEKSYSRQKREVECSNEINTSELGLERDKRASGNFLKNRVFTRMMLQNGWPMAFQSMAHHSKNFFAWGGKRSSDVP